MRDSAGREALAAWLAALPERSQSALARALGVTQPLVATWLSGTGRPVDEMRVALEGVCGIPAAAWLTDEELARVERIVGAADQTGPFRAIVEDTPADSGGVPDSS